MEQSEYMAEYKAVHEKCIKCCGNIHEWVAEQVGGMALCPDIRGSFSRDGYVYSWSVHREGLWMKVGSHSLTSDSPDNTHTEKAGRMWHVSGENCHYMVFISEWQSIKPKIVDSIQKYNAKMALLDNFSA